MALTKLVFDPIDGWNDTIEFPENPDDSQVRPLLQKLHDETKAYLNNVLTAEIEGTMATKAELAEVVAGGIPDGTITVDKLAFDPTEQPEFDIHIADYVRNPGYASDAGSLNAYAITVSPIITAYTDGQRFTVAWNSTNTATSSLNVCGLGPITILDSKGNILTAGKIKIDVPSTVVYFNGNFILQGEGSDVLTGNMVASDLLAGKTGYSNDPLTKITGIMPNKVGSATVITVNGFDQAFPQGYYGGVVGDGKVKALALIAGDTISASSDTEVSGYPTVQTKKKEIQVNTCGGNIRVKFDMYPNIAGKNGTAQIYVNGSARGTVRINTTNSYVTYTEDIAINAGDTVQLYIVQTDTSYTTFIRNFRICTYVVPTTYTVIL